MHRVVHRGGLKKLVRVLVEPTDERSNVGIGGEEAIYLFMDFDMDRTCGFDGTQVLLGDGC